MQGKLQEITASIRRPPYLPERMFPQLRERFGPALDLIVEFSTLGEYRLGADGALCPASALAPRAAGKRPARPGAQPFASGKRPARPGAELSLSEREPQLGGAGAPNAERAAVRRIVAGGAVGRVPAATPAAGRPSAKPDRMAGADATVAAARPSRPPLAAPCQGERRHSGLERRPGRPTRPRKPSAPEQLCFAV